MASTVFRFQLQIQRITALAKSNFGECTTRFTQNNSRSGLTILKLNFSPLINSIFQSLQHSAQSPRQFPDFLLLKFHHHNLIIPNCTGNGVQILLGCRFWSLWFQSNSVDFYSAINNLFFLRSSVHFIYYRFSLLNG